MGNKLFWTAMIGLISAIVAGLISHSVFYAILVFAFISGGDLFVAYWRSMDNEPGEKPE
ncbi:MAG: hypothetical protein JWR80_295 [Bradyrhizobium sp.]|nr:hypothetical protein [Bradyrhizobium sp.]